MPRERDLHNNISEARDIMHASANTHRPHHITGSCRYSLRMTGTEVGGIAPNSVTISVTKSAGIASYMRFSRPALAQVHLIKAFGMFVVLRQPLLFLALAHPDCPVSFDLILRHGPKPIRRGCKQALSGLTTESFASMAVSAQKGPPPPATFFQATGKGVAAKQLLYLLDCLLYIS